SRRTKNGRRANDMRPVCSLVMLALALLVQPASAQSSTQMRFRINKTPPELAKSIVIEGSTGEHQIELDGQGIGNVEGADIAWETSTIGVLWNDDTSTSFPVHISLVFVGLPGPVDLHFHKDEGQVEISSTATSRCVDTPPTLVRQLFQMLRECRR